MEQKDNIREAFSKIKQEILELKVQISFMQADLEGIKHAIEQEKAKKLPPEPLKNKEIDEFQQICQQKQSFQEIKPTNSETPADKWALEAVKTSFMQTSNGNGGVPADRQTNQQTDQHKLESSFKQSFSYNSKDSDQIDKVSYLLNSLNEIKSDLKTKFKHLTKQEMLIFSTIYQLEEEHFLVDYPNLATKLGLTESSIRDYVQKLIKKGIPIQKSKENNKKITLSISPELKKIASLQAILSLKEL